MSGVTKARLESRATFDLRDPLPSGLRVLEASAGTGKTHTIADLATRYVAAGTHVTELLVVTFTRAATAELRERIWQRLREATDGLTEYNRLHARSDLVDQIARETDPTQALTNLEQGLANFDTATITTIHGFCQQVLSGAGMTVDIDADAQLIERQDDLVQQVVDDALVERFTDADPVAVPRDKLLRVANAAVAHGDALLLPSEPDADELALRVWIAQHARTQVARRKRQSRVLSYDDVLTLVRGALRDPDRGTALEQRLRGQYRVALIDEFQDTDPVQWEIISRVFAGLPLILIGDPKQAIYSFRGADVHAYVTAVKGAGANVRTLATNWRSDAGLLRAFNMLFDGATLGEDEIAYQHVEAIADHSHPGIVDSHPTAPLRLRLIRRDASVRLTNQNRVQAASGREFVARDVAVQIVEKLSGGSRMVHGDTDVPRPVRPGDLAVLVRLNAQATLVQQALRDAGVPAVINGVGSVFDTPAAYEWLRVLQAIERPSDGRRARSAALTSFFGWSADQLAQAGEVQWDGVHLTLHRWSEVVQRHSVAALWQAVRVEEQLPERLLNQSGGERLITDLDHIADLLHAATSGGERGATSLAAWLSTRIAQADTDAEQTERARRLESDAEAVQVLTIHRSKGLEFPVVYCPFLWLPGWIDREGIPIFHDDEIAPNTLIANVAGGGPDYAAHVARAKREQRAEDLRLMYVAMTRAQHQVVLWWGYGHDGDESPLSRLLFCRKGLVGPANSRCQKGMPPKTDDDTFERLRSLAARAQGDMKVETVPPKPAVVCWNADEAPLQRLSAATFDRPIDAAWRRTSYSGLTARAHGDAPVQSDVDSDTDDTTTDELLDPGASGVTGTSVAMVEPGESADEATLRAVELPLGDVAGGTQFGTYVHGVLEHTVFAAPDVDEHLRHALREQQFLAPPALQKNAAQEKLATGLRKVLETPLGALADGRRLADLGAGDRLDEMNFDLPLAGGWSPRGDVSVRAIGEALAPFAHDDAFLAGYLPRLDTPDFAHGVHGYLTGSIDLVCRGLGGDGYLVVDYKTNRLGGWDDHLTAWHYRPGALSAAMYAGHYPLQALLYSVALHRYLRWRLPSRGPHSYHPEAHLGGVLYLFVRGMIGADTPIVEGQPCGVFSWRPSPEAIIALCDLLNTGAAPS